jgi:hypothetical protein
MGLLDKLGIKKKTNRSVEDWMPYEQKIMGMANDLALEISQTGHYKLDTSSQSYPDIAGKNLHEIHSLIQDFRPYEPKIINMQQKIEILRKEMCNPNTDRNKIFTPKQLYTLDICSEISQRIDVIWAGLEEFRKENQTIGSMWIKIETPTVYKMDQKAKYIRLAGQLYDDISIVFYVVGDLYRLYDKILESYKYWRKINKHS